MLFTQVNEFKNESQSCWFRMVSFPLPASMWTLIPVLSLFIRPPVTPTMVGRPSSLATTAECDSRLDRESQREVGLSVTVWVNGGQTKSDSSKLLSTVMKYYNREKCYISSLKLSRLWDCDWPASLYDETGAERVKGYPAGISSGRHQYLPVQTLETAFTQKWWNNKTTQGSLSVQSNICCNKAKGISKKTRFISINLPNL